MFRPSIFDASSHSFKISGVATTSITSTGISNTGTAAFGTTSASGRITLGQVTNEVVDNSIILRTGSTKTAWLLGAQFNTDNGFEITPSTAVGGTTFSTPVFRVTSTGVNSTAIGASFASTGAFTTLSSSSTTTLNGTTIPASSTLLVSGGALGTPASGTVTNLTGTASININGTVGASTPNTGVFTTLSATAAITTTVTAGLAFNASSATTGQIYQQFGSTGGTYYTGLENSAGSAFGATAYALFRYAPAGRVIQDMVNGVVITSASSTGVAITGALSATGNLTLSGIGADNTGLFASAGASPRFSLQRYDTLGGGSVLLSAFGSIGIMAGATASSTGGTLVGTFSTTGLAVTGGITTTADITVSGATALAYRLTRGAVQGVWQNGGTISYFGTASNHNTEIIVNNTTVGAFSTTGLSVTGTQKLVKTVTVNSSTQTIVTNSTEGVSGLCWIRDASVGGQALVLWDVSFGLTIVSQLGSIFTTSSPSATEIQLSVGGTSPYYVQAIAGATRNGDVLSVSAINNQ